MTKKSCIGFGSYKTMTVQDLINLGDYKGLIDIYYGLAMCTYDKETLEFLNITGERAIDKPGIDHVKWAKYGAELVKQLREINGRRGPLPENEAPYRPLLDSHAKRDSTIQTIKGFSKQLNMNRNRKK
jgi:hypothetical protein